jgi:predicted anti-sigma-YlaC factor YlaD
MSKHVIEWLNAYLDSELKASQVQQLEAHLVECETCRAELEALARLSSLLHEVPPPEFTPPERFAAQVSLRLPRQRPPASKNRSAAIGWWLVPVGLLASWIFIGTSFVVSDILAVANNLGLFASVSDWLVFDPVNQTYWSATLGQFGMLSENSLGWAISTETLTRASLLEITLQVSISLLYLSWLAVWWARRRHQGQDQLLES